MCAPAFVGQRTHLGHVISAEGVTTDPKKIEAVTKWPQPVSKTCEELPGFLLVLSVLPSLFIQFVFKHLLLTELYLF